MEKTTNKRRLFAGMLALSAGFILASCDPVSVVPKTYKDPIVVNNEGQKIDLDDNILGTLYDSIATERNAKIVSDFLEKIAEEKFGTYAELVEARKDNEKRDAFIAAHPKYYDSETNNVNRFNEFVSDIDSRISEAFYNEITSGSYNDDLGRFSEEKLYRAHKYELYDLKPIDATITGNKFFVSSEVTKENVLEKNYIHADYYSAPTAGGRGYIEEKVYPDLLKNKLVEDYVFVKNPSSLGRAYARKVSYVKVSYEEGERSGAFDLMKAFSATYIKDAAAVTENRENEEISFEFVNYAIKGFNIFGGAYLVNNIKAETDPATDAYKVNQLVEKAFGDEVYTDAVVAGDDYEYGGIHLVAPGTYNKKTKLGKIIEAYQKALKAEKERFPNTELKNALDKFTKDGKSKQYGLLQEILSLAKEDCTTKGWFVKNGGITELPEALRGRLFNIKTANILDDASKLPVEGSPVTYDEKNYVRNIHGRKVVLPDDANSYSESEPFNYIYHDFSGKAYYICQVLEAPSTAKLSEESSSVYKLADGMTADKAKIESLSRQVAKVLATKDSYIKDAYTEYLNQYKFTFFDSSLYDYFKSEYPDLDMFDED